MGTQQMSIFAGVEIGKEFVLFYVNVGEKSVWSCRVDRPKRIKRGQDPADAVVYGEKYVKASLKQEAVVRDYIRLEE